MKKIIGMLLLLCSIALTQDTPPHPGPRQALITNVYIVSPENLDHIEKGSVLIKDGRIERVERAQKPARVADAEVIDGKSQYLIPGLIDSHVHAASVPGMGFEPAAGQAEMVREYFKQLPRSYLYYGYTTLVDLIAFDPQALEDFRHAPLHPDLYDCGGALAFANGYPMNFAPAPMRFKMFPNFIYDPAHPDQIPAEYKPQDHTPAADVARVKASGGICIKMFFERGFAAEKDLPVPSAQDIAEVRKAATKDGLVLMIHASGIEAQKFALDGNVDVIAHGMWHWGKLESEPQVPDEAKALLDQIAARKIGYQPTMQVLYGEMAYFDPDYLKMPAIAKVVPKAMIDWFQTPEGKAFGKEVNPDGVPDAEFIRIYEQGPMRRVRQATAYLASKDANFVFGTDTPSGPTYGNLPGLNGYLEMKQLQKAGLSLTQIFRAATISNAREFRMDSQIGTIEPGKVANLLLMKKSPLETLDAYDSITTVFIHGKQIDRESLAFGGK